MCIFCAAIPAAAALGAAAHGKQAEARRRADDAHDAQAVSPASTPVPVRQLPIAALTGVVVAGLIVGSIVTHVATASG